MKRRYLITLNLLILAVFVAPVGAQHNTMMYSDLPENSPADVRRQAAGTKPLTNKRVVSLVKSGIGDDTIISLISQFPSEFDVSLEALIKLHDAGVSGVVINAIKRHVQSRPPTKPALSETLTDMSARELARLKKAGVGNAAIGAVNSNISAATLPKKMSADLQKDKIVTKKHPASGKWALGLVYPGAAIRYQTSEKTAWEVKAQSGSGVLVAGPRFYYYFSPGSGLSLFCGAEGDYIAFKGKVSKGSGFAGGAFIGGGIPLAGQLSLSMDFGPMYMSLSETEFSESVSGIGYIINMGIYWHFK